jgi:hypothetical protein
LEQNFILITESKLVGKVGTQSMAIRFSKQYSDNLPTPSFVLQGRVLYSVNILSIYNICFSDNIISSSFFFFFFFFKKKKEKKYVINAPFFSAKNDFWKMISAFFGVEMIGVKIMVNRKNDFHLTKKCLVNFEK